MKDIQEPVKKYEWTIRVRRKNQEVDDICKYKATHGPVTAEHVRQSPFVKEWIAGDRLVSICPSNAELRHGAKNSDPEALEVAQTSSVPVDELPGLVRRELEWHPGPAIGGGGTAQENAHDPSIHWWRDGDLLLVIVAQDDGLEVSCVRVYADGNMLNFANAATGDLDFGWTDQDISWWARLDGILPQNVIGHAPAPTRRGSMTGKECGQ